MDTVYKVNISTGRMLQLAANHPNAKNYFITEELAQADYKCKILEHKQSYEKHKPTALVLLNQAEKEFKELQSRLGVEIDYFIAGDTYGIYAEGMRVSIEHSNHYYSKIIGN